MKISGYKMSKAMKSRDFDTSLLSLGVPERKSLTSDKKFHFSSDQIR